jgi:maltose/maltodextrin transport system permease protein
MGMVLGRKTKGRRLAAQLFVWVSLAIVLYPLLRMILFSLLDSRFFRLDSWPRLTLRHWQAGLGLPYLSRRGVMIPAHYELWLWIWNSLKVAGITALSSTLVALSTAYAFARLRFSGRYWLDRALFMGQMFPSLLLVVAFYTLFDQLGEYVPMLGLDTHGGLILALFGQTALGMIWAFKGFFAELPKEIEEAARIDGASDWQIFWRIALPLARPMIAVMVTLTMTGLMYEPMLSTALLTSSDKATIATGLMQYSSQIAERSMAVEVELGDLAAVNLFVALPSIAVFLLAQRWIESTINGAVKA